MFGALLQRLNNINGWKLNMCLFPEKRWALSVFIGMLDIFLQITEHLDFYKIMICKVNER